MISRRLPRDHHLEQLVHDDRHCAFGGYAGGTEAYFEHLNWPYRWAWRRGAEIARFATDADRESWTNGGRPARRR